jgi:lactobin A/cerein 7B family class IIb bacteriocin
MLELENFGLIELNAQEQAKIDGGVLPLLLIAFAYGFGAGFGAGVAIGVAKYLD